MRLHFTAIFMPTLFVMACNTAPKDAKVATEKPAPPAIPKTPTSTLGEQGTKDLMTMIGSYYELKDALVATNASKADAAASRVLSGAETMHNTTAKDGEYKVFQAYVDTVSSASEAIINLKDETCEKKRAYFEKVSNAIYGIAKAVDLKNAGIYHQYCPMAFNEKGAFWLSNESEIKNPYFGKKMLECGEVKDSL